MYLQYQIIRFVGVVCCFHNRRLLHRESQTAKFKLEYATVAMSLRSALLTLLSAGPHTGYDLAKTFHSSVGFCGMLRLTDLSGTQKMQAEELIEGYPVP